MMNSKSYFCIAFGPYELYETKNVYDTENDFWHLQIPGVNNIFLQVGFTKRDFRAF